MKNKNLDKLIKYHKEEASSAYISFERIDNISFPFSADRIYENYEKHNKFVKILEKIKEQNEK